MVNEDIITALKNGVEHGESLQNAITILINSGYPPNEVQEASKFIGFSSAQLLNSNEQFIMPEEKGFLPKMLNKSQNIPVPANQISPQQLNIQPSPRFIPQNPPLMPIIQQLPQRIPTNQEIKKEISPQMTAPRSSLEQQKLAPEKPSYKKEIILLIILLILIGVLISTLIFKNEILTFFS
jgi:hypothetical protein